MKQVYQVPSWVLAIFDDSGNGGDGANGGDGGGNDGGQNNGGASGNNAGANSGANAGARGADRNAGRSNDGSSNGGSQHRSNGGRWVPPDEKIHELNEENQRRRLENANLRTQIDEILPKAQMADVMAKRALRGDAITALRDEGVLHDSVVDIFLASAPEVKIDEKTGQTVGLDVALPRFKQSHAALFKAAAAAAGQNGDGQNDGQNAGANGDGKGAGSGADGKGSDGKGADGKSGDGKSGQNDGQHNAAGGRRNATARGASTAGSSGDGGTNTGGLPDLRGLDPAQRKSALDAYKRSLRIQ